MAQRLRAETALPGVLESIPSNHNAAHNLQFQFRESDALTQTYIQSKHQCT